MVLYQLVGGRTGSQTQADWLSLHILSPCDFLPLEPCIKLRFLDLQFGGLKSSHFQGRSVF